ncbi:MAG: MBL fold metallo-hydrolase [Acidobacteriia bacterium]|nr:MBL fold metallo-hydrolase [Terriglobia bacterium]
METAHKLQLRFWGVRGSTPSPGKDTLVYGGNTPCVEIRTASNQILVFDGGSGIRELGRQLAAEFAGRDLPLNLFLTHFHWDHIQGIPYFQPLFSPATRIDVHSWTSMEDTRGVLEAQMQAPYFPVSLTYGSAKLSFAQMKSERLKIGDVSVESFPLNHPQGAYGYRIEAGGKSIVYATDLEHGDAQLDRVLRDYASGADVLIYDAQYNDEEYAAHRGWGHSTWHEATRVARDAGVGRLFLFHFDPAHTDARVAESERLAAAEFEPACAAREGSVIQL